MKCFFKLYLKRYPHPLSKIHLIGFVFLLFSFSGFTQSIVEQHGRLRVVNNHVVNKNNTTVSLAGNSIFWSNFSEGAKFYNAQTVNHIATDWNSDIIRAAMGVENPGGYITNPQREKNKVKAVVDAAINAGIYVIIDWHSHNAEQYQSQAIEFFSEMAELYGTNDHVIYEVYNEPIAQSWQTVKSYSEAVIRAIRAKDPDNLIVVGSPQWSQKVVDASNNPINDPNTAYTLHFYSGTHKQFLRDEASRAMNNGIALFVTEWGAVNANGDGAADRAETQRWLDFIRTNGISHANWSISDKAEGASVVASGTEVSGLLNNNLTSTGIYIKDIIENWNTPSGGGNPPPPPPSETCSGNGVSIINNIEAEAYCQQKGTRKESTRDTGGGQNIGYIDNGDYLRYRVNIPESATYTLKYRVASIVASGKLQFKTGNTSLGTVSIPNTQNWQSWTTIETEVNLNSGSQTIELFAASGRFNINWFSLSKATNTTPPPPPSTGNCSFGTPLNQALASTRNSSYTKAYVLGLNGPNLTNITNFTINWDLANNGLYQFSVNTNNGSPNWWVDLRANAIQNFNAAQPSITLSSTGFTNLDGTYWVALDGTNFVMKSTTRDFTIYFSNQNTPPNCSVSGSKQLSDNLISIHPVPTKNNLNISGLTYPALISIVSMQGSTVLEFSANENTNQIDVSSLPTGHYFLLIQNNKNNKAVKTFPFVKE
ncbi:cellulase family glycosylhydrolase [Aquimarina agarilytica]|uniref:cellulase family glycosylhydrolase n=1 Tax=Aquimarina agarilytica TaxID=1087449 RepID=UPI000289D20C|nr:cellulase family glycosylhydrolase [Aquimarina agarilytica]